MLHIRGLLCVVLFSVLFQVNCYQNNVPMDHLIAVMNGQMPFNFQSVSPPFSGIYRERVRKPMLLIKHNDKFDRPSKITAKYNNGFFIATNFKGQSPSKRVPISDNYYQYKHLSYTPKPKYSGIGLRIIPAPKLVASEKDVTDGHIYSQNPSLIHKEFPITHSEVVNVSDEPTESLDKNFDDLPMMSSVKILMTSNDQKIDPEFIEYESESQSVDNTYEKNNGENLNIYSHQRDNKLFYRPAKSRQIANTVPKQYASASIVRTHSPLSSHLHSSLIPRSLVHSYPHLHSYASQPSLSYQFHSPINSFSQMASQFDSQIPQYHKPLTTKMQSLSPILDYRPRVVDSYLKPYTQTQLSSPIQSYANSNGERGFSQIVHLLPFEAKTSFQRIAVPIDLNSIEDKQISQSRYQIEDSNVKLTSPQSSEDNQTPQTIDENAANSYVVNEVYSHQNDENKNDEQLDNSDQVEVTNERLESTRRPVYMPTESKVFFATVSKSMMVKAQDRVDHSGKLKLSIGDHNESSAASPNYNESQTTYLCPNRDQGFHAVVDTNCQAYYQCYSGINYKFVCPDGALFDQRKGLCDWTENSTCDQSGPHASIDSREHQ